MAARVVMRLDRSNASDVAEVPRIRRLPVALVFASSIALLSAQSRSEWDVTKPFGPTTEIAFETNEGTWMNLDVSPDGRQIVFDLLGDIYVVPIAGGRAGR